MLYVRNGSGCSRRQTASAARPEVEQARPLETGRRLRRRSARPPSTARCKIAGTVEDKVHSFRGQAQARPPSGRMPQPGELRLAQVIRQEHASGNRSRLRNRGPGGGRESGPARRRGPGPRPGSVPALPAGRPGRRPGADHPEGEHERQPGQVAPGLAPGRRPAWNGSCGTFIARSPITRTASAVLSRTETPSGSGSITPGRTRAGVEPDPRQRLAGPRARVQRQAIDLGRAAPG